MTLEIIEKYIKENKPIKLNLACGQTKIDGFIGIDIERLDGVDIVWDLEEYPWPFQDNSVDEIFSSHFIEHAEDLISFMDEIYRILKPQSKATIIAPYYSSIRAWQDPTHKRAISEFTFLYFNKNWRDQNKLNHYNIKSDFDFNYGYQMYPEWMNRAEEARAFAMKYYWNVISDIHITLTKR